MIGGVCSVDVEKFIYLMPLPDINWSEWNYIINNAQTGEMPFRMGLSASHRRCACPAPLLYPDLNSAIETAFRNDATEAGDLRLTAVSS